MASELTAPSSSHEPEPSQGPAATRSASEPSAAPAAKGPRLLSDLPEHETGHDADAPAPSTIDEDLLAELPTFELFFKTFGFKRIHGRVWGLLVLTEASLSSKEITELLGISQGTCSTTLSELTEWGAIRSEFDSARRCHLHSPVGNALSIVATVFRRREQVAFQQFKLATARSLELVTERYGPKDRRVATLRSIISTCEIGEALMQLVFSAVGSALGDPQSILSRAIHTALKVGVGVPAKVLLGDESKRLAELLDAPEVTGAPLESATHAADEADERTDPTTPEARS